MPDDDMIAMVLDDARDKMAKAVDHARAEFTGVRTGRAAPALVEKIPVDYYGTEVPMQQIAGFTVPVSTSRSVTCARQALATRRSPRQNDGAFTRTECPGKPCARCARNRRRESSDCSRQVDITSISIRRCAGITTSSWRSR